MGNKYVCPNHCDLSEEPFPYLHPACCVFQGSFDSELGIYCNPDGSLSDTWEDGTRGTDDWQDDGCLPICSVCKCEVQHA